MRSNLLKLIITLSFGASFAVYLLNGARAAANQSGPPPSHTGAPGELTCATTLCHNQFAVNSGTGTLSLTGLPANYSPSQEIDLTVTMSQTSRQTYGFEITAIDNQGRRAGELIVTNASRTQKISGVVANNFREYIQHNLNGSSPNGTNQGSWTFRWRAPAQSVGRVTFYVAGNAGNGNGQPSGQPNDDRIYTINRSIEPAPSLPNVASVSAASFVTGPLAAEAIAAAFGSGLSQNVVLASTVPLPTELDGTRVSVRDAAGQERLAPLFFVAPAQINYLVPQGTAPGAATVTVRRTSDVAQGTIIIETVAPALFAANANGQGVAAAVAFRLKANGEQTFEAIAQLNPATGVIEAIPIDLGPEGDQVFLIAYGSGFRGRSSLAAVMTTIGGENAETIFAAASPDFIGLDQANIRIPRALIGRGNVDVVFKADNKTANTVTINIK